MEKVNVVWFKRDIRTIDHEPLKAALESDIPVFLIFIFEPSLIASPQYDERHWRFIYQSIQDVNTTLREFESEIFIHFGEAYSFFEHLSSIVKIDTIYSHLETGIGITYSRDRNCRKFFKNSNIDWIEFAQNGVQRGIKNRKKWAKNWDKYVNTPIESLNFSREKFLPLPINLDLVSDQIPEKWKEEVASMQVGGEKMASKYLNSFFTNRVTNYSKHISKPEQSRRSCSRLSPYLAWGNLTIRQVYQAAEKAKKSNCSKKNIENFQSRLKWHCHFIQKFEMECRMEYENLNPGFDKFPKAKNEVLLNAWKEGKTGYPLVDASMRCLNETGYLNFRMRAMLVSFLTHHLLLDWRDGAYHLARQFLDFEPGIHYPQLQMQAGVTGINLVRIYNPVKQSYEQDPEAVFIKKWVPQLNSLPINQVHEPWKLTQFEQLAFEFELGKIYPFPIVDPETSGKIARDLMWKYQKDIEVIKYSKDILKVHTLPNRMP